MLSTGYREEWGGRISALYGHWGTRGLSILGEFNLQHMGSGVATKGEKKVEDYPQEIFISQNWPLSISQSSALWLQHDCWNRRLGTLPHTVPGRKGKSWILVSSRTVSLIWVSDLPVLEFEQVWEGLAAHYYSYTLIPVSLHAPLMFLSPHSHTISFLPASSLLFYLTPWGRER